MKLAPASWDLVPQILEILKKHGDAFKTAHNELKGLSSWQDRPECPIMHFLTPGGKVDEYGTYVIIIPKLRYWVQLHTSNPNLSVLANDMLTSPHIDWKRSPVIGCNPERLNPLFDLIEAGLPNSKRRNDTTRSYHIAREDALKLTVSVPDDMVLAGIGLEHAELINSLWPHKSDESIHEVRAFLTFKPSRGLFKKDTGELVAWCLYGEYGGPALLQTVMEHRRKGYGEIVMKSLTKLAAENGVDPHCFIVLNNQASMKLFTKTGYTPKYLASWVTFTYHGN